MKLKLISIALIAGGLAACGGGGGGGSSSTSAPAPQTKTLQGVAIDGYISGATAFLDINYNGVLDEGEPSSITDDEGSYQLSLTGSNSDCMDYAPIVVNVPVGAIDADSPNSPITEPYQLVFPPVMTVSSDQEIKSTTPLTTVLWNQIQADLYKGGLNSCSALKQAVNTQNSIIQNVKEHDFRIANRYNIAVKDLYGDFVKAQNTELYELAQKMMPAIKKSYQETKDIQKENPKAQQAYVDYYWEHWDYSKKNEINKWYKVKTVMTADKLIVIEHEVSADLQTELELNKHIERNSQKKNGLEYDKEAWFSLSSDGTQHSCSVQETIKQQVQPNSLTTFGVKNSGWSQQPDWESCSTQSVGNGFSQTLTSDVVGDYKDQFTQTQVKYHYGSNAPYPEWVNLGDTLSNISRSDFDVLNYLSVDFNENTAHGSDSWTRHKYAHIENTPFDYTQTITSKDSQGNWTRGYYYQNGTSLFECSNDGVNWSKNTCK
ncbi:MULTISPECIES: hypothetical protein [Vibrio]|uniref:Lipoprotein n=1 Tax=Vibrio tasmaniensis TaxID=212663 RepID=A0A2N7NES7_9VIBR|nr:hypothetical protein [Vibrio tasmaniensis]OEF78226.1 hypothetical protein A162_16480 [Vibrio tasmaniensis 1F-155]PMO85979.1 hypothetical protein BCT01_02795 [Vibrio tasmaniensis]PMP11504.1 hypothetical protein BCS92_20285 [Vibrio tasmaniensis]TKG30286.1 hypothetical protein FC057_17885 [Vibrio tasmaniensis]TKG38056.1 hypothetical protein FC063_21575 [Vibrio tasmaniensis]